MPPLNEYLAQVANHRLREAEVTLASGHRAQLQAQEAVCRHAPQDLAQSSGAQAIVGQGLKREVGITRIQYGFLKKSY